MTTKWVCRVAVLLGLVLLIQACGAHVYHRVRQGETLYAIGWRYGQDYRTIAQWNGISPPYVIHEGQVLRVAPPTQQWWEARERLPTWRSGTSNPDVLAKADTGATKKPAPVLKPQEPEPGRFVNDNITWRWPTEGAVVKGFSNTPPLSKGVDIRGSFGQPIYAAAPGKVVYSGSGLIGYGKLVIIKHNKVYLSAYAYNDQLLVKEGDEVGLGQEIARMGRVSAQEGASLHFEIRRNGEPVDPMRFIE